MEMHTTSTPALRGVVASTYGTTASLLRAVGADTALAASGGGSPLADVVLGAR